MNKAIEYRQHAQECRTLARNVQTAEQRSRLQSIAEAWDKLAAEHEKRFWVSEGRAARSTFRS